MLRIEYPSATYIIGTARQIRSLYRSLYEKTDWIPLFAGAPLFNGARMYALKMDHEIRAYYVIGETDVVYLLMGKIQKATA